MVYGLASNLHDNGKTFSMVNKSYYLCFFYECQWINNINNNNNNKYAQK